MCLDWILENDKYNTVCSIHLDRPIHLSYKVYIDRVIFNGWTTKTQPGKFQTVTFFHMHHNTASIPIRTEFMKMDFD